MIITIARQCGCDALQVGEILAKHYGIPLYTRKSLMEAAKAKGVFSQMRDFFEERPVDEFMSAITFSFERPAVAEKFSRAFTDIIGNEDCIIIGRCGNFIFKDREDLVSVFLHGRVDERIRHIANKDDMSMSAAEEFVHKTDDCRIAYHKFYTGLTWGNAPEYDLCIDCCRLGAGGTAQLIEDYISEI